jgi:hypothetical protein
MMPRFSLPKLRLKVREMLSGIQVDLRFNICKHLCLLVHYYGRKSLQNRQWSSFFATLDKQAGAALLPS